MRRSASVFGLVRGAAERERLRRQRRALAEVVSKLTKWGMLLYAYGRPREISDISFVPLSLVSADTTRVDLVQHFQLARYPDMPPTDLKPELLRSAMRRRCEDALLIVVRTRRPHRQHEHPAGAGAGHVSRPKLFALQKHTALLVLHTAVAYADARSKSSKLKAASKPKKSVRQC